MRRLWLPDYEKKLIMELQRQQNSDQFCDTLLQTEGVSIPTHSSVLGALSLPLSQRLSASLVPPAGQKRRLQLHTVKPRTLIKLVSLLYSGELNVNGAIEQQDILAAAHLFGLPDLVEEKKFEVKSSQEGCREKEIGSAETEKRDMQIQVRPRTFYVSTGTQTLTDDINWTIENWEHQMTASPSLPKTKKMTSETLSLTMCQSNSSDCSDGEPTYEQSDCMTSISSSLLSVREKSMLRLSPNEDSNCSRLQEGEVLQNLPGISTGLPGDSPAVKENGQRKVSENREWTNLENTESGSITEMRQAGKSVANKSLRNVQEIMEATQIAIKVKLRRRGTKEKMWEVVNNMQDTDVSPLRPVLSTDNYLDAKLDANDDTPPAEKRPCTVSLKEFQELIKHQHSKTLCLKDKCEKEKGDNAANWEMDNSQSDEIVIKEDGDEQSGSQPLLIHSATLQKTPPKSDNNGTSYSSEKNVSDQSGFCISVIADELPKLSEEIEDGQKALRELLDEVAVGASEYEVTTDDVDVIPLAASIHQENVSADRSPGFPELKNGNEGETGEYKLMEKNAVCPQDDEEVDVLLHSSPDTVSATTEVQKVLISSDEEEGEESNDVDVTGSETDSEPIM